MDAERIELLDTRAVGRLRQRLRLWTRELGFSAIPMTKLITAASELARNVLVHGGGGEVTLDQVSGSTGRVGIRMRFVDRGAGIADLDLAFTDGYSTGTGLGLGLSGARRLLGDLRVQTGPEGTMIEGTAWKR